MLKCREFGACLGAASRDDHNVTEGCAAHYEGNLCLQCSPGYSRAGVGGCSKCPSPFWNHVAVIGGLFVVGIVVALVTRSQLGNAGKAKSLLSLKVKTLLTFVQGSWCAHR